MTHACMGVSVGLLLPLIVIIQFTTTEAGLGVCRSVEHLGKGVHGPDRGKILVCSKQFEKVQLLGQSRDLRKREKCSWWVRS